MTALEKVLLLVSFRKSGELSKDDKSEIFCWKNLWSGTGRASYV